MDVNSAEEAEAVFALKKLERTQKIENQISRLSYFPALTLAIVLILLFVYKFILNSSVDPWIGLLLASANIAAVGQALVKRGDLLYQLTELKHKR